MPVIHWENLIDIQLVICALFMIYYVYALAMLISSRNQIVHDSFFIIFIVTGIFDVLVCVAHQFFRASARLGLGPQFNALNVLSYNIMAIAYWLHVNGNLFMSLCQYTAVCWPYAYKQLWSRSRMKIYYIVAITIAIAVNTEGWFLKISYILLPDGSYSSHQHLPKSVYIAGIIALTLYIFTISVVTSMAFLTMKDMTLPKHMSSHYRTLILIIAFDFFLIILEMLYQIRCLLKGNAPLWLRIFLKYASDFNFSLMYLANPVMLVILNRTARSQVFRQFRSYTRYPMIHWEKLFDCQLIICLILMIYYVYTLVMLGSSRNSLVHESIFLIFITTGIFDIVLCISHQFNRATDRLGLGPEFYIPHLIMYNILSISYWLHVTGNLLMSVCQYTAVCRPFVHKKIWTRNRMVLYFFASITIAVVVNIEAYFLKVNYTVVPDGSYKIQEEPPQSVYIAGLIFLILYIFSVSILTSMTIFKLKDINLPKHVANHYKTIVFVIGIDFFLIFLEMLYEIRCLMNERVPLWLQLFLSHASDFNFSLMYLVNPIIVVILNRTARSQVFRQLRSSAV